MDILTLLLFIAGLALLILGAEALVRGASEIATSLGVSSLIIGLTIVAFGTSAPELVVSLRANLMHQADLSLGNVVGSNIFNVLFILGLSALIRPLSVSEQIVRLDVPIMIATSLLVFLFGINGMLDWWECLLLTSGIIVYTTFLILKNLARKTSVDSKNTETEKSPVHKLLINILFVIAGLGMLVLGSNWLIKSAVIIAQALGFSPLIIGLTVIAAGTSLPELATSVIASIQGKLDIAVGNIIGSNIFNVLAVLGISGIVSSQGLSVSKEAMQFDILIMIAISILCFPFFISGFRISRWEGLFFLLSYAVYLLVMINNATNDLAINTLWIALGLFLAPSLIITIMTTLRFYKISIKNIFR